MDNQVWDIDFEYSGVQSIKVSCHPGDQGSRAISNMIGDQPLFYIDDSAEDDFLLEELLLEEGLSSRDKDMLDDMRAKINAYDRSAKLLSDMALSSPINAFDKMVSDKSEKNNLDDTIHYALHSGTFKSYYDFATASGIKIIHDDTVQSCFYDRDLKLITLNSNMGLTMSVIALMESLRTAWLHSQGALINPLTFLPEQAILMNRMIAADNNIAVIAMAWDMKLAGIEDVWMHMMSGSDYDLCAAYAMETMTDWRSIKSGLALRATFEKWFISGRCKSHDRDIIQTMMGKHTDITITHEDASRTVALDMIAAMGTRPEGKNYLSKIAVQIMNDGLYLDVRDRSNANFLWFITFERKMSNMEQELQEPENEVIENVIDLPQKDGKKTAIEGDHVASVFFLDHFRAG